MKLNELSSDQIRELKAVMLFNRNIRPTLEPTEDVDVLVSEQELYEEYGDIEFHDYDFVCTAPF